MSRMRWVLQDMGYCATRFQLQSARENKGSYLAPTGKVLTIPTEENYAAALEEAVKQCLHS